MDQRTERTKGEEIKTSDVSKLNNHLTTLRGLVEYNNILSENLQSCLCNRRIANIDKEETEISRSINIFTDIIEALDYFIELLKDSNEFLERVSFNCKE